MALHLIKMAAGISSLAEFQEHQDYLRAKNKANNEPVELMHVTRYFPRRADEIFKPRDEENPSSVEGSLYWVFQKRVQARQKIAEFRDVASEGGLVRCGIVLEGPLVPVDMMSRKAFQGWRYLLSEDAPEDLRFGEDHFAKIPPEMQAELRELCLI